MSPAGHWPELRAAVEAGANAVYMAPQSTESSLFVPEGHLDLPVLA
jgi:collagenase-like PrtC family protease